MSKITNSLVHESYALGKKYISGEISLAEAKERLINNGMSDSSSAGYIYFLRNLVHGKLNTRTINGYATDYFLNKILEDYGQEGLSNALLSQDQHLDYYEGKSGSPVHERREIFEKYLKKLDVAENYKYKIAEELDPNVSFAEGKTKKIIVNSYERNIVARKKCIEHYGSICQICNFNFKDMYGTLGEDFIHVHHKINISSIGNEYSVNPIDDLIPVCPNCHAMLHKKNPAYTIEELRKVIKNNR
jgi:5-methylcytosine-specific restriction protein A